ncbi:MAG: hypothetical protein AB7Q23_17350 [Hyphomonadaceae bacterium]
MKKIILGAAAAMAIAAPGTALAQSGYAGLSYQSTDTSGSDIETTSLSGAALLGEHFQLNGRFSSIESAGDGDAFDVDAFVFSRGAGGAFGGFVGFGSVDLGPSFDEWSVGAFGQWYSARTTYTAQLGYSDTDGDIQVTHLDGEARHFVTDNFSLQGNIGLGQVEFSGSDGDYWSAGVGAEFQFSSAPVSIYGGWQHIDDDGGEFDTLGVGIRYNWGGTLFERNRSGASMQRATPTYFELLTGGDSPR